MIPRENGFFLYFKETKGKKERGDRKRRKEWEKRERKCLVQSDGNNVYMNVKTTV